MINLSKIQIQVNRILSCYRAFAFSVMVQILFRTGAIAVQLVLEPEICQGAELKCDKQLTHIVRVSGAFFLLIRK